jgi:outer membrane protein assembly factor BamB
VKVDARSRLVWANPIAAHHDMAVLDDGRVYVLTRKAHMVPRVYPDAPVLEDFVTLLDSAGEELRSFSLLEALERSPYRAQLDDRPKKKGDIFHTNSLEVLEGRLEALGPHWKRGNLLLSSRKLDAVWIVDPESESLVWSLRGDFKGQHDPTILANGHLLLFDNQGRPGASSVQELDPATGELVWEYRGSNEHPFYTRFLGTASRLSNGNTLVTESENGRAFEVTTSGKRVWEFYTPHRAGTQNEFIASMAEMTRLPVDFPTDWASGETLR